MIVIVTLKEDMKRKYPNAVLSHIRHSNDTIIANKRLETQITLQVKPDNKNEDWDTRHVMHQYTIVGTLMCVCDPILSTIPWCACRARVTVLCVCVCETGGDLSTLTRAAELWPE